MRKFKLIRFNKKLSGYFLLILFCGYFGSITLFPHSHIVDGVTIVHSHAYKSQPDNLPFNHNHSKKGFIFIQLISNFIATAPILFLVVDIIRRTLDILFFIPFENFNLGLMRSGSHRPRAPAL